MKILGVSLIALLLAAGMYFILSPKSLPTSESETPLSTSKPLEEETVQTNLPIRASFAIFTNGTYRIFTDPRYHNLSEGIYLEASQPNVVTITSLGMTWQDLFATLPMELTADCLITGTGQEFCSNETNKLRFFINDQEEPDALGKVIAEKDRLLVTYGDESQDEVAAQLERVPRVE